MRKLILLIAVIIAFGCAPKNNNTPKTQNPDLGQLDPAPEPQIAYNPKNYICYRTNSSIKIDGKLDESSWQNVVWTDDFVDIEGDLKPLPRFKTQMKMLWDDVYFYVGVWMEEPDIWATLKKRDSVIFRDNDFEVFIDPDGDTYRYYELEVNAFGTEWDLFLDRPYRDNNAAVDSWDIQGLKTGVFIDGTINRPGDLDKGWSVEIAIPWDVLRECAPDHKLPSAGDQWRMNFSRVEWKVEVNDGVYKKQINPDTNRPYPEANWAWSPQGLINLHYPEMWGYVQFSDKAAGNGEDVFLIHPDESAKWALRRLYYRQRKFLLDHEHYADKVSQLNLEDVDADGYQWPPEIQTTWNLFEAKLKHVQSNGYWHIDQHGYVWKSTG